MIFITLVIQGPTLAPIARWLGIRADEEDVAEEAHARLAAAEAGLRTLDSPAIASSKYPEVVRYLRQRHRQRARRWAAREAEPHEGESGEVAHEHFTVAPSHEAAVIDERRAEEYRRVRSAMLDAEEEAILALRDRGVIADDVMRRIQRDLDLETSCSRRTSRSSNPLVRCPPLLMRRIDRGTESSIYRTNAGSLRLCELDRLEL